MNANAVMKPVCLLEQDAPWTESRPVPLEPSRSGKIIVLDYAFFASHSILNTYVQKNDTIGSYHAIDVTNRLIIDRGRKLTHQDEIVLDIADKLLKQGDKAKITMLFRGREMNYVATGRKVLERLAQDIAALGEVEKAPYMEGKLITMIIMPK